MAAADSFAHCQQIVREHDRDRFLTALFAPADARPALFALYAFDSEIARVRDHVREPMPGEIRLQWWREAIEGGRDGEAAAHPVAAALLETIHRYSLPREALLTLIEARSFDLYNDPMPSLAALTGYSDKTHGAIVDAASRVLGDAPKSVAVSAAAFGLTLSDMIRQFPRQASRGQLYWPLDLLRSHGGDVDSVSAGQAAAPVLAVARELIVSCEQGLASARPSFPPPQSPAWAAFLPLVPARLRFEAAAVASDPYRPQEPAQWRKQWRLWRAARRPDRIV
jgi:phytoene synthase